MSSIISYFKNFFQADPERRERKRRWVDLQKSVRECKNVAEKIAKALISLGADILFVFSEELKCQNRRSYRSTDEFRTPFLRNTPVESKVSFHSVWKNKFLSSEGALQFP